MFDYHYDLLTEVYINQNNIQKLKEKYKRVYNKDNITGGIFNLFFMSEKQMEDELNISRQEINLKEMLYKVHKLIIENNIIPKETKYVYGIEGLDYLEKIDDVEYLYKLGVRLVRHLKLIVVCLFSYLISLFILHLNLFENSYSISDSLGKLSNKFCSNFLQLL